MSHNEGKAYNISSLRIFPTKRIGCDQGLNQLSSSGLGYAAEYKRGLRSKNPFIRKSSQNGTLESYSACDDIDTGVWGLWTQQSRPGFWFSSPWPSPCSMNCYWGPSALTGPLTRCGAGEGELFIIPATRGLKLLLPDVAMPTGRDRAELAILWSLEATYPHLEFIMHYCCLFNNLLSPCKQYLEPTVVSVCLVR